MPSHDDIIVGKSLLQAAAGYAKGKAKTLLMCIEDNTPVSDVHVAELQSRYAELGYHYTHLRHFVQALGDATPSPISPAGVQILPLAEASPAKLRDCILHAFSGSAAKYVFGNSDQERDTFVGTLLDSPASQEPAQRSP